MSHKTVTVEKALSFGGSLPAKPASYGPMETLWAELQMRQEPMVPLVSYSPLEPCFALVLTVTMFVFVFCLLCFVILTKMLRGPRMRIHDIFFGAAISLEHSTIRHAVFIYLFIGYQYSK